MVSGTFLLTLSVIQDRILPWDARYVQLPVA